MSLTWAANVPIEADCHYVRLTRDVPLPSASSLRFAFAAWLGDADGNLRRDDLLAHLSWAAADGTVIWSSSPGSNYVREQGPGNDDRHPLGPGAAPASWHDYAMSIDLTSGALSFTVDGSSALPATERVRSACLKRAVKASMSIGFFCASKNPNASEVRFDDVTFTRSDLFGLRSGRAVRAP